MENRYCMHCGMPIPRKAKICPECGTVLSRSAMRNDPQPPQKNQRIRGGKQTANKLGLFLVIGFFGVFCAALFFIANIAGKIKNANSRHREAEYETQHTASSQARPEISIPEISMPEISFPDIHFPEPPAAAFAVESYEIETNLMGETVLYVNISYTNKAEDQQSFFTNFRISVQQDGNACMQTAGNPAKENHLMEQIQPDETALVSEAFIISTEKETAVSVSAFLGGETYLEETVLPHADGTVSVSK